MTLRFLVIIALVSAISLGKEISVRAETAAASESKIDYLRRRDAENGSGDRRGGATWGCTKSRELYTNGAIAQSVMLNYCGGEVNKEAWLLQTVELYRMGAISQLRMINACDEVILVKPKSFKAYYYRGLFSSPKESITDFTTAIQLKSDYAEAYTGRGNAKYKLGDKQGAIADHNKAISINANFAESYYGRGLIYKESDKEKALADFRKAWELFEQEDNNKRYEARDRIVELGGVDPHQRPSPRRFFEFF